jgi:amino acid transporter
MEKEKHHSKLNQLFATAICGNDILSSTLYVSGIAIVAAGIYAPIALLIVVLVLFFYKAVYTEVVEALPINGGAYNCLLNGTSKTLAAIAGVTTVLSYIATAVISGVVGVEYALRPFSEHGFQVENLVIPVTIVLLLFFAVLVIMGIKDSAKVAFGIFSFHILSLILFIALSVIFILTSKEAHFSLNVSKTSEIIASHGGLFKTLFFAFALSLLGVSGFESSANFVEEQEKGVFRKTLRNMLIGVAIFNPIIAFMLLNSMPYEAIKSGSDFLLADAAKVVGGPIFQYMIAADAFLVLAGAVLTAYVGVSGLIYRMSADDCLPGFLSKANSKGSFPRIIIGFFLLCTSILLITNAELSSLAGVYTIAFLGVMSLFALGNLILRQTRRDLKRTYRAKILFVVLAFFGTALGIGGNIRLKPENLVFFGMYFIPSVLIVLSVVYYEYLLKFMIGATKFFPFLNIFFTKKYLKMAEGKFVIFVHHTDRLHTILDYINRNENGKTIILAHCKNDENVDEPDQVFKEISEILPALTKAGLYRQFKFENLYIHKPFSPEVIDLVAKEVDIEKNRILIGSIHNHHKFDYSDLGGVRIIF